jgi:ribosomal protein S18 acetylase RimI-like enzyme
MEIRLARISDLKFIQDLNLKLFEKEQKEYDKLLNLNWTLGSEGEKYYSKKIKSGNIWIALDDNKIIGYLCGDLVKAESYRNLPLAAELESMFILDEYRSKGIGKMLYDKFLKWCEVNNVKKVRVQASAQNNLAIKFYKKLGFTDYTLILESDL